MTDVLAFVVIFVALVLAVAGITDAREQRRLAQRLAEGGAFARA